MKKNTGLIDPFPPAMDERRLKKIDWVFFRTSDVRQEVLFSIVGAILGLGSPVGALFLRYSILGRGMPWSWMNWELATNTIFYFYMGFGTVAAFSLFGYFLGTKSENQRVQNLTLRHRIEKLHLISVKDPLTKAFSHAFMQENLQLELLAAKASSQPLSIVMLDFDDFKKINDMYGHLFGDNVLATVCETIRMNIRLKDILCRYGGEEFMILMPETDIETARQVAERVRVGVASQVIPIPQESPDVPAKGIKITLSLGVSTFNGRADDTPTDLIRRADINLYRAKREGKNRTCITSLSISE